MVMFRTAAATQSTIKVDYILWVKHSFPPMNELWFPRGGAQYMCCSGTSPAEGAVWQLYKLAATN